MAVNVSTPRPFGYVYIRSEPSLWTVGFYRPDGKWEPESDHDSTSKAADRVNFLMGGNPSNHDHLKRIEKLAADLARPVGESLLSYTCGLADNEVVWPWLQELQEKARELLAEIGKGAA